MRLEVIFGFLLFPCLLRAQDEEKPPEVGLISETRTLPRSKVFLLGLHFLHPPGAHTYWKYPGIVGLATKIDWDLPTGFTAGEIQWPEPGIVKMASYQAQGYEGETLLVIPITAPALSSNEPVTLSARVSWMCCGKTCKPAAEIPFSITLPVGDAENPDPTTRPIFAKFHARIPINDIQWRSSAKRGPERILVTLTPPAALGRLPDGSQIHFFTADGQVDSNQEQQATIFPDGKILLKLPLAKEAPGNSKSLPGVVEFGKDSGLISLEINPAY